MEHLKEKLWKELEELDHDGKLSVGDLELAHKLTDTIKNIDKICMLEDGDDYSGRTRRGEHYVRGHYSHRDGHRDSRGRYAHADGRSKMMEHLEMALDSADEHDREDIRRFMRKLEDA